MWRYRHKILFHITRYNCILLLLLFGFVGTSIKKWYGWVTCVFIVAVLCRWREATSNRPPYHSMPSAPPSLPLDAKHIALPPTWCQAHHPPYHSMPKWGMERVHTFTASYCFWFQFVLAVCLVSWSFSWSYLLFGMIYAYVFFVPMDSLLHLATNATL